jgi:hypothetical protein
MVSCSTLAATNLSQSASGSHLVKRLITAAETQNATAFAGLTLKSKVFPDWQPPKIDEVDRRDEGCKVRNMDAISATMILVYWLCSRNDHRYLTERTFLIESGRVIYMWDDWGREVSVLDEVNGASPPTIGTPALTNMTDHPIAER